MKDMQFLEQVSTPPDPTQAEDRDVTRVARVRMTWNERARFWEFDPPQGVSTYYTERKKEEVKQ